MAIEFDTSRKVQGAKQRLGLVRAILNGHSSDECEWLEWKTDLDLGQAQGRFAVARCILGLANRSVGEAARFVEGQGFLVLGVEPNNLVGTASHDPANLEDWLVPYLAQDGPTWDAHYVVIDGKEVLLFEVAPPRAGDPIHTLKKTYDSAREGLVYVRHKGKTDPATSADMAMLSARLMAGRAERYVDLEASWSADQRFIKPLDLLSEIDELADRERDRLLRPLDSSKTPSLASLITISSEKRDPKDYRAKVDTYIEEYREAVPLVALSRAMTSADSLVAVRLENRTDSNFLRVEVTLTFEDDVIAIGSNDDTIRNKKFPSPPRIWGSPAPILSTYGLPTILENYSPSLRMSGVSIYQLEAGARLRFTPLDLRPQAIENLESFYLFADSDLAGQEVTGRWEATSTSADGVVSGTLSLQVEDERVTLSDLLGGSETS